MEVATLVLAHSTYFTHVMLVSNGGSTTLTAFPKQTSLKRRWDPLAQCLPNPSHTDTVECGIGKVSARIHFMREW
jgi:hypothetical protein